MIFPVLKGSNLLKQKLILPKDFEGNVNLVFIPFWRWQQVEVDSWGSTANVLEKKYPALRYYELPTIQRMNPLAQYFIDEGMRGGIPDPAIRKRTITLYIDKSPFRRALELGDEDHIYLMLVDRQGGVHWQARGPYQLEIAESLFQALEEILRDPIPLNN